VHHVNPDDFLRRNIIDTNGDVSMLVIPALVAAFWIPLDIAAGRVAAVFVLSFAAAGWPTNQVHQWAHMPQPPRAVRWQQDHGIILSRAEHSRHHRHPYAMNYCIALGWLNRPLTAIDFFRRLERFVTAVTGLQPRSDDADFQSLVFCSPSPRNGERGQGDEGRTTPDASREPTSTTHVPHPRPLSPCGGEGSLVAQH
jgi:ubiquitin-conjugating enzyme E2 variant